MDYYTSVSFVVKATKAQAEWLVRLHEAVRARVFGGGELPEEFAASAEALMDENTSPSLCCKWVADRGGVWLYSEMEADVEYAVRLVRCFIQRFDPTMRVAFTWAYCGSRPAVGAYGGGACVVSADTAVWMDAQEWIAAELRRSAA